MFLFGTRSQIVQTALIFLVGVVFSLFATYLSLAATHSALRTGVAAPNCLGGGFRRNSEPIKYWFFVGLSMLGTVTFLGVLVLSLQATMSP
ncbi:MAG: hypothetical protein MPJ50_11485 [Pirellulales bacterium]|nr:hypothetical protein [Pirellulales bacterium]